MLHDDNEEDVLHDDNEEENQKNAKKMKQIVEQWMMHDRSTTTRH